jgi:trimethylamine--corrinoid protein Co-methyltransferase
MGSDVDEPIQESLIMSVEEKNKPRSRKGRRASGGRSARKAARASGSKGAVVHPGLSGGQYKVLSDHDIVRIHDTALKILEEIGIGGPTQQILDYALPKGCTHDQEEDRLKFPRALVEDILASVPKSIQNFAPNPDFDPEAQESTKVFYSTGGEGVFILDYEDQHYRPSELLDIYDTARLVDQLEHIHQYGQPFIANAYSEDLFTHDINVAYAELAGTQKPFAMGLSLAAHIDPLIELFDTFAGERGSFLKRPFCTFGGCPIVSPLRFGEENLEVMIRCAELGLNYDIAIAAQAGATAPAALAGSLVQTFAETLGSLVCVNLVRPKTAMSFGMWPFISDLRTGAFSGGGGEQALVMAATRQICNYYGLVSSVATGMTDSKTMDAQAGYEKAISVITAALAGGNSVCTYAGSVGSIMGTSYEGLIIDNDMLGNIQRVLRGIEVTDETLSYDVIKDSIYGVGHFLGQEQTLELMQTEYLYPDLADRRTPGEWENSGKKDIYELAHEKAKKMLADYYPEHIKPEVDQRIRDKFDIRIAPAEMKRGNGRW